MKLDAVGVKTTDLNKTVQFYKILGFEFPEFEPTEQHLEAVRQEGQPRLMIDSAELLMSMTGEKPHPANTSAFALLYDTPEELNEVASKVALAGFKIFKEPWDAFWGQRYAIVEDPDGHRIDLFSYLKQK